MKSLMKVALFALALLPGAVAVAERPMGTRQRSSAIHDRSPRVRERTISVRSGR